MRKAIWSRYWAAGAAHSCAGSFGTHYAGAIGRWWEQEFASLSGDERLLDIATGSGAVLQLALKHCPSPTIRLDGVDAGQVSPDWIRLLSPAQARRVHIHPGVQAELLPFENQTFDRVTSQFGLEYTKLDQSLAELRRVLRVGGSLRCILHHASSRSVSLARVEVAHIRWLLAPDGLLALAEQLCEPFARAATAEGRAGLARDLQARALRDRFNERQDERLRLAAESLCPDVLQEASDAVTATLRAATAQGAPAGQAVCRAFAEALRDAAFRLCDLIDHALTTAGMQALSHRLPALQLAATFGELRDGQRLMGWWLKA